LEDVLKGHANLQKRLSRYAGVVVVVAAVTAGLLPFRDHLSVLNAALIYLLVAVPVSARWGFLAGLFMALVSIVTIDFFFVPPVNGLASGEMQDLAGLAGVILVISLSAAFLSQAKEREEAALLRSRENDLLYQLSTLIISDLGSDSTLTGICSRVRETFSATSAAIFSPDGRLLAADGRPELRNLVSNSGSQDAAFIPNEAGQQYGVAQLALRHGGDQLGSLRVQRDWTLLKDDAAARRLLRAFAQVAALAIHHSQLMEEVTAKRALQEADVLKSALLGSVSHELRTPLGSIKAAVTSLLEPGQAWSDHDRGEFLAAIDGETDRLTAIVSNLLDLSRIEGGALQPDRDWYDVAEFLETTVSRARCEPGRVQLRIDQPLGVASFDYVQLGQVLSNLLENALKFTPAAGTVHVTAARTGSGLEILVRDQGPGVPAADRPHIFERFYRGKDAGVTSGTGLGLTISKGLVAAHGGTLTLLEDGETGAAFRIFLPDTPCSTKAGTELAGVVR
jgi:two-component system sensor histidine kinase KdpD